MRVVDIRNVEPSHIIHPETRLRLVDTIDELMADTGYTGPFEYPADINQRTKSKIFVALGNSVMHSCGYETSLTLSAIDGASNPNDKSPDPYKTFLIEARTLPEEGDLYDDHHQFEKLQIHWPGPNPELPAEQQQIRLGFYTHYASVHQREGYDGLIKLLEAFEDEARLKREVPDDPDPVISVSSPYPFPGDDEVVGGFASARPSLRLYPGDFMTGSSVLLETRARRIVEYLQSLRTTIS